MTPSYTGHLLVASPRLEDPVFGRSVCLMMHHESTGAIGLMLNRPLRVTPQFWALFSSQKHESRLQIQRHPDRPVHFGGPSSGPVVALHTNREFAEAETAEGIYIAAHQGYLKQLIGLEISSAPVRLIIGHVKWGQGRLEEEIEQGLWYPIPATVELVFDSDEWMWPQLVRKGLGHSLSKWIGIDSSRINPNWN